MTQDRCDNSIIQSALLREKLEQHKRETLWIDVVIWIILVLAILLFLSFPVFADDRDDTEQWFAACLNGTTIQVGDTLFQCLPAGVVK